MKKVLGLILTFTILSSSLIGCTGIEFEVSDINIPEYAVAGEEMTVSAMITNTGSSEATYSASVKIDGTEVDTSQTIIAAGESELITLEVEIGEPGTYTIDLNGNVAEVTAFSPSEIIKKSQETNKEAKTMQMDMAFTMKMEMTAEGETVKTEAVADTVFSMDVEKNRLAMVMNMNMAVPGTDSVEGTMETYLIGDSIYTRSNIAGADTGWNKEDTGIGKWEDYMIVDKQLELAEVAEIEFLRMEMVDGENCFVFKIIPDEGALLDAMMSMQQGSQSVMGDMSEAISEFGALFGNMLDIEMEMYISEGTLMLKKTTISGDIDLSLLAGFKMDIQAEMDNIRLNEPVSIELPDEAKDL